MITNIRELIDYWSQTGKLMKIKKEVDPDFELGAVVNHLQGRQPMYFEKVKGSQVPMIAGFGGDRELVADSMGLSTGSELVPKLIESVVNPLSTNRVSTGPVHENVILDPHDLEMLFPLCRYHELDFGKYYVAGVLVVKDIAGNKRYTSIRRMRFIGGNRTNILITSPELNDQYYFYEQQNEPMEIAVMFGVVPAVVLSSQVSTHLYHTDKFDIAGALIGKSLDVVKCKTVDLEVLAEAEVVFEGRMLPHTREIEGPFGELAGYYGKQAPQPVIEISAVTYRNNPIWQTIHPSSHEELLPMAIVREATLLSTVRQVVPGIKDCVVTLNGASRCHAVIQIQKRHEGDGKQACLAAFASDKDLKHVVVVNDDVNIWDPNDVEWAIATRVQADQDIFIVPGAKGSPLEASHNLRGVSAKMGIDATYPLHAAEEFKRKSIPWGPIDLKEYL